MKITLTLTVPPAITFDATPEEVIVLPADAVKVVAGALLESVSRMQGGA